jgi:hypothetical protein
MTSTGGASSDELELEELDEEDFDDEDAALIDSSLLWPALAAELADETLALGRGLRTLGRPDPDIARFAFTTVSGCTLVSQSKPSARERFTGAGLPSIIAL